MKLGFSSYSFFASMASGALTLTDVIDWIGTSEGEHMEVALVGLNAQSGELAFNLDDDPALVDTLASASAKAGVELSGLCIPANFLGTSDEVRAQVDRAKRHVEIADRLGMRFVRHDVTEWARRDTGIAEVESSFPGLVEASKEVAQHAATYGITTSIENHGFFMNASERVRRLIHMVDEPNFKTTLDVGNFLCVDEDPMSAVRQNLPYASFVHLKDFYTRPASRAMGDGWLTTPGGTQLLGSIVGYGDLEIPGILAQIAASDYDGFVSIEFEGIEDPLLGCERGLANARTLLAA